MAIFDTLDANIFPSDAAYTDFKNQGFSDTIYVQYNNDGDTTYTQLLFYGAHGPVTFTENTIAEGKGFSAEFTASGASLTYGSPGVYLMPDGGGGSSDHAVNIIWGRWDFATDSPAPVPEPTPESELTPAELRTKVRTEQIVDITESKLLSERLRELATFKAPVDNIESLPDVALAQPYERRVVKALAQEFLFDDATKQWKQITPDIDLSSIETSIDDHTARIGVLEQKKPVLKETISRYVATGGETQIPINIADYNPETDVLQVYEENLRIFEDAQYTITTDAKHVILKDYTALVGDEYMISRLKVL